MESLNDQQYATVVSCFTVSASLSILGSGFILYMVLPNWRSGDAYQRIMGALSVCSLVLMFGIILQTPLRPRYEYPFAWGNRPTCTLVGVLVLWGSLAIAMYNTVLSLYFLLLIQDTRRRQQPPSQSASAGGTKLRMHRLELLAHIVALGVPTFFILLGLATESFNHGAIWGVCGLSEYPMGCDTDDNMECTRGQHAENIMRLVTATVVIVSVVGFGATGMLYAKVRRQLLLSNRHSFHDSMNEQRKRHIQQVRSQATWYTLIYLNYILWPVVYLIVENAARGQSGDTGLFVFRVVSTILYPLQGFLNAIVFVRPKYVRLRQSYPDHSGFLVFRDVVHSVRNSSELAVRQSRRHQGSSGGSAINGHHHPHVHTTSGKKRDEGITSIEEEETAAGENTAGSVACAAAETTSSGVDVC